jgi:thiamine pyrophosphate-dependent acetolactate synthase large subunit-like protein
MVSVMTKFDRRHAVAALLQDRDDLLVICGLGSPSYDVHAAGDHDGNYYLWGAMGAAALIGLGLAQAQPERKVAVITGDGEQLMGLGGLATIAVARPKNLAIIVIDNGHFGETGMQMSHTGHGIEIAKVAEACGIAARIIDSEAGLEEARASLKRKSEGPVLYVVKVRAKNEPRSLPARDAVHLKNRFRGHLGLAPT